MRKPFLLALILFMLNFDAVWADVGQPVSGVSGITPVDCSGTVVTGTTAVTPITGSPGLHGFIITNLDVTEALWVSFTGTAAVATVGSHPLAAGAATTFAGAGSFASPLGAGFNTNISVNATTAGHKFSCTKW